MLEVFIRDGKFTQVGWVTLALVISVGCAVAWIG
jgi:hypothetical protein